MSLIDVTCRRNELIKAIEDFTDEWTEYHFNIEWVENKQEEENT